MVTYDELYQFLKTHYRPERFEKRNGNGWDKNYSHHIAAYTHKELVDFGYSLISRHESRTGEAVIYDRDLNILDSIPKKLPVTVQGEMTHD